MYLAHHELESVIIIIIINRAQQPAPLESGCQAPAKLKAELK